MADFNAQEGGFAPILLLDDAVRDVMVQEDPGVDKPGVMRVRVPFYIGESITRAPGIPKKIHFPTAKLPDIIQEGKRQIAEGKQPLQVYARHAHATSGGHLPVGAVVDLEQDGRTGYAVMEISPTDGDAGGKNVQTLLRNKHLNAVSLRSSKGRFELESKQVNGESMFQLKSLMLDGIDFAPDAPAQPTYGMEILQEDASVTDEIPTPPTRRNASVSDLTLEALRAEHPSLIAEIEAPHKAALASAQQERDVLLAEKRSAAREAKLREIAAQFPKPEEALPLLLEECKGCETDEQVAAKALPILLEAFGKIKRETVSPRQQLLGQFHNSGKGQAGLQQERKDDELELDDLPRGAKVASV